MKIVILIHHFQRISILVTFFLKLKQKKRSDVRHNGSVFIKMLMLYYKAPNCNILIFVLE